MENTIKGKFSMLLTHNFVFDIYDFIETNKEQIMWRTSIV